MSRTGRREIDWGICDQCLSCVEACIYGSINVCGATMEVYEVVHEVMKDEDFYINSGGGVTISGGESLLHVDFVVQLLKAFKDEGLHTAVDTSGCLPWSNFEKILPYTDLILFDIKHLDSHEHIRATGVDNNLIMENLENLSGSVRIWLRLPLITGFNDSEEYMRRVADLGKKIGAEKVSLLPYHEGGKSKCEQMGKSYPLSRTEEPNDEHVNNLKEILRGDGLKVSVGN